MVICLQQGAKCKLLSVQLMPLPPHHLLFQQNPEWFTFLAPAYPGCPRKKAVNCVHNLKHVFLYVADMRTCCKCLSISGLWMISLLSGFCCKNISANSSVLSRSSANIPVIYQSYHLMFNSSDNSDTWVIIIIVRLSILMFVCFRNLLVAVIIIFLSSSSVLACTTRSV